MKPIFCESCGSNELTNENDYWICAYCGSKTLNKNTSKSSKDTNISIGSDIKVLLQKCKDEPVNARKYANLILDIDPYNEEALKYI